jgi:hypothetical protein
MAGAGGGRAVATFMATLSGSDIAATEHARVPSS